MEQLTFNFANSNPVIERLQRYHAENPGLYETFKAYTFEAIESGYRNFSARMIVEKIRWETGVVARNSDFKIDNGITAFYARLFMEQFPQYRDYFRTRASVTDSVFS